MPTTTARRREFQWGRWALVGCVLWIALVIAVGVPAAVLATPALGPITGWLVGGVVHLAAGAVPRR
jgi:nitrogen fixation protein FixH